MQEIKFRGQGTDTNDWYYGYYFVDRNGEAGILETDGARVFVEPETVCQYTGFLDKNGVEIYKDDLTHAKGSKTVFRIEWYQGAFFFVPHHTHEPDLWQNDEGKVNIIPMYLLMKKGGMGNVEIIGNIHENPELLESKAQSGSGEEQG